MSASTAKRCFGENVQLFADPQINPEKYNLYNGLWNLAGAIEAIERKLGNIEQQVNYLKSMSR